MKSILANERSRYWPIDSIFQPVKSPPGFRAHQRNFFQNEKFNSIVILKYRSFIFE